VTLQGYHEIMHRGGLFLWQAYVNKLHEKIEPHECACKYEISVTQNLLQLNKSTNLDL